MAGGIWHVCAGDSLPRSSSVMTAGSSLATTASLVSRGSFSTLIGLPSSWRRLSRRSATRPSSTPGSSPRRERFPPGRLRCSRPLSRRSPRLLRRPGKAQASTSSNVLRTRALSPGAAKLGSHPRLPFSGETMNRFSREGQSGIDVSTSISYCALKSLQKSRKCLSRITQLILGRLFGVTTKEAEMPLNSS